MPQAHLPKFILHPRAAPPDRLRLWVGAFDRTAAPVLQWTLDGAARVPAALRPVASARGDDLVAPGVPRAFTGVYEMHGPDIRPGTRYRVTVADGDGETAELETSTLPAAVPQGEASFNVLLLSCFYSPRDRAGLAAATTSRLPVPYRPHLTLFLGDQVYLDLPALANFPNDAAWLAEKFERDYRHNWCSPSGLREVRASAPSASTPDDHDYWNNYPHVAYHIQNTWSDDGRRRWRAAAGAMFDAFQRSHPAPPGHALELDVPPLYFFVMDTRSRRDEGRARLLDPGALAQLRNWAQRVAAAGGFGVLASGAPLTTPRAGNVRGRIGDYALADYGDYAEVVRELATLASHGRSVLLLTGDVHWGRVTEMRDAATGGAALYELISSPTALVETIGVDQIKSVGAALGGLFGRKNPWPRHPDPAEPPPFFAPDALDRRLSCRALHGQRGSHAAVLSFRRAASGLDLRVSYWPIHDDMNVAQPSHLEPIRLRAIS